MRSNPEFSPRMLVAACCSALGVLFSIPASAHPIYLTGENYTWHYDVQWFYDTLGTSIQNPWDDEVQSQVSFEFGGEDFGLAASVTGSYESQQQSSDDAFSFSARSSVSAEGYMSFDAPEFPGFYSANIRQNFYYLEFLVTEEARFLGNLALTDALFLESPGCDAAFPSNCPVFGEVGETFLSGSILGPGTYRYWSGSPSNVAVGNAFDGFASVYGGRGTASSSSFTQFIDMRFTAVAVPTPSTLVLMLGGFGLMLLARSRRFRNARADM